MFKGTWACNLVLVVSFLDDAFGESLSSSTEVPDLNVNDVDDAYSTDKNVNAIKLNHLIDEYNNRSQSIIDMMLTNDINFINTIATGTCNTAQQTQSNVLRDSIENMMKLMFLAMKKKLSSVKISKINKTLDKNDWMPSNVVYSLELDDVILKGLENASLTQLNLDLCLLKSEWEIYVPKLEIESKYILEGIIQDDSIYGNGNGTIVIEELYVHAISNFKCQIVLSKNDSCELSIKNTEQDIKMKNATMKIAGIKFRNMDEAQFNDAINNYIELQLKSDSNIIVQTIARLYINRKNMLLNRLGPVALIKKMKKIIGMVQDLKNRQFNRFFFVIPPAILAPMKAASAIATAYELAKKVGGIIF